MRTTLAAALILLLPVVLPGCGGLLNDAVPRSKQGMLSSPDKVTFYTLVSKKELPGVDKKGIADSSELVRFGEYGEKEYWVLDSVELDNGEAKTLISAFTEAVKSGKKGGVKCFAPHHALRIEKDGEQLDILICFMCHNYLVHPDGGYNNVHMSKEVGMEEAWREVVRAHGLKDISEED